jgi:protocatechuate 3,4-dioxygenase beta subunit
MNNSTNKSANESVKQLTSKSTTRRNFMRWSIGILGTTTAMKAVAQLCGLETGKQPLGPFFPNAGTPVDEVREIKNPGIPIHLANDNDLTVIKGRSGVAQGQQVLVKGVITDKNCQPIPNATIIIWQASNTGRYNHKGDSDNHDFIHPLTGEVVKRSLDEQFQSWGKAISNEIGEYTFKTIVPGFYPADLEQKWYRPPHIHFLVMAKGYPQFVTQLYFKGDALYWRAISTSYSRDSVGTQ